MGNILSRINDDYDEYVELCESLNIKPKWITDGFYEHLKELTSMDKQDKTTMIHPCDCTDYNGGQCYNCLNGAHEFCDKCNKSNDENLGLNIQIIESKQDKTAERGHWIGWLKKRIDLPDAQWQYVDFALRELQDHNESLQAKIQALEERLEAADELIEHPAPSSNNWDSLYEKYQSLKQ